MKNEAFIALLITKTMSETDQYLSEKEARDLPDDLSHLAKKLIGQNGQKKEDVFRNTGLSRDYLYKVLRGVKRVKERDYILAVCLAAGLDLIDTGIMLETYHLEPLSLDNERDVLLIHSILSSSGLDDANRLLESGGWHPVRTSPKDPSGDLHPYFMKDICPGNIGISYAGPDGWKIFAKASVPSEGITLEYRQNGLEKSVICKDNGNDIDPAAAKIWCCYLEGMIWRKIRDRIENSGYQQDTGSRILSVTCRNIKGAVRTLPVQSGLCAQQGHPVIMEEVYQNDSFYQISREPSGCTAYLKSRTESLTYFFLHFLTGSDRLYCALYGTENRPEFSICGCDMEELDGADDRDIAVFLRMQRNMKLWRLQNGYLHPEPAYYRMKNLPGKEEREKARGERKTVGHFDAETENNRQPAYQHIFSDSQSVEITLHRTSDTEKIGYIMPHMKKN